MAEKDNRDLRQMDISAVNRKYKDRLFKMIFGSEDHKAWALSLYNAIHQSNYSSVQDLTITTMDEYLYMNMRNDVSFVINEVMSLYEHQSTVNPNMPVRGLFYFAGSYRRYIEETGANLYGKKRILLPAPE